MINMLKFVSVISIFITILFIANIMYMELQSQGYVQAQNSSVNEVSMNDTSRFYIPITISKESQEKLENITSNIPRFTSPGSNDLEGWKKLNQQIEFMIMAESAPILDSLEPNVTFTRLGNVNVLDIKPKDWTDSGKVLVYTHGGGYTILSANSTLSNAAIIANTTGLRVISIDYTLAPLSKWNQTTDEVVSVIKTLVNEQGYSLKDDIAMFGDSAGGGLVAGSVLKMRDEGVGIPAAIVLWSPWTDVTGEGDTYVTLKNADLLISEDLMLENMAGAYANIADQKNPYVSPIYGDFSNGFSPALIQVGTKEILLSDSVRLYQALDQAGIAVKLDVYEGMPHVFQSNLANTTESNLAIEKTGEFLEEYLKY
jgi:epsilon-lactone hydrolase